MPEPGRPHPIAPGGERGVTLIELLVVMALVAALLGIGISMFTNLGKQGVFSATTARVLSDLNRVRNSSMTHPAALQITAGDPEKGEENSVRGIEFVPLFQSQCEPPSGPGEATEILGAMDRNGLLPPGAQFRDGVIGRALFLEGGGAVDCGKYAAYDATEGISVDLWVFPTSNAGGTLVRRGDGLVLSLTRQTDGVGVRLDLGFASGAGLPGGKPESVIREGRSFEPRGVLLPLQRWTRIVASYDRSFVTLLVDSGRGPVEKLRVPEKSALAPSRDANLYLGGGGSGGGAFRGGIDDIRIEGVLGADYMPFPPQVTVQGPSRRIHFVQGKLDPAFHSRPETLVLQYGRRVRTIVIGLEGNVTDK